MRESRIEQHLVDQVKAAGGMAPKFKSPQRNNVPDRIVLKDGKHAAAAVLDGYFPDIYTFSEFKVIAEKVLAAYISFVELKATGEEPNEGQLREHARLRALGFDVQVIDTKEGVDAFMRGEE